MTDTVDMNFHSVTIHDYTKVNNCTAGSNLVGANMHRRPYFTDGSYLLFQLTNGAQEPAISLTDLTFYIILFSS